MAIDRQSIACGMGAPSSIIPPPHRRHRRIRWRNKHYLSVAMVGALVAIALVVAISICLAPARLTFSISRADIALYGHLVDGDGDNSSYTHLQHSSYTHLNFTLVVNNSSTRTAVRYGPMSGEISYGPAATAWVRYDDQGSRVWHEPNSPVHFNFSADYGYNEHTPDAVASCRILMESKVWFAWRGLPTLPYTVRFSCEAVNFKDNRPFPVICH